MSEQREKDRESERDRQRKHEYNREKHKEGQREIHKTTEGQRESNRRAKKDTHSNRKRHTGQERESDSQIVRPINTYPYPIHQYCWSQPTMWKLYPVVGRSPLSLPFLLRLASPIHLGKHSTRGLIRKENSWAHRTIAPQPNQHETRKTRLSIIKSKFF